ncbi:guanylate kinase [Henriciella litoralis]|uniref:guanylate kinase n=1 Tax=Henriciella litoralis TaxID=568102 RepID=UPI0009FDD1E0|nr:guanylate kinase [Henriciella litoralis]
MSNSGHPKDHGDRRGLMLVISSPSGAGKTTLARKLMDEFDDIKLSVSATTRDPRPGEIDGKDYHFKSRQDFREMISRREFLEWALVFDNLYGTPRADTERLLEAGHDVLFDVDWQGADALHDQMPRDVVSVFVLPPSIEALKARLAARPGSTDEIVERRMRDAKAEMRHWRRYDYAIVNDDLDVAYQRLKRILLVERLKRLRQLSLEDHVRELMGEA